MNNQPPTNRHLQNVPAYSTLSLVVSLVNMALKNHSKRAGWDCKVHALIQVIKSYNKQQSWPGGPEHLRSAMKLLRDAVVIRGGYHDMSNVRNLAKYMENIATVNDRPLGAPKKDRATVIKGEKNNFFSSIFHRCYNYVNSTLVSSGGGV